MGARLVVDVNETDDLSYVRLSGIIDEDNDLAEVTQRISKNLVVINTADVDRINSCGVRDWVNWLGELEKKGGKCFFAECSPAIMAQVNLVNNFVGSGQIISFYSPYFCSACDTDKMLLIAVNEALQSMPFRAPTCRCDQCDHTMEFDDIESSYFAFLSNVKNAPLEAALVEGIKRFSTDMDGKLRARSSSMPVVPSTSSSASGSFPSLGTTPSSRDLKGLLTDSISLEQVKYTAPKASSSTNKILYLIIGLLAIAIGLLGYVVIRSS